MKQQHNRNVFDSLKCAVRGFERTFATERNFRIEVVIAPWVFVGSLLVPLSTSERLVLLGWILAVIVVELLNTAIERAVDTATQDYSELARDAKDIAATAVLLVGTGALVYAGILAVRICERMS